MKVNNETIAVVKKILILKNRKTELFNNLTHTVYSSKNKPTINFHALLKLYARDG